MDKHIAAEAAVETFRLWFERIGTKPSFEDVQTIIQQVPAADVEPVRHGRWVPIQHYDSHDLFECSECGRRVAYAPCDYTVEDDYPYCHCGAKMAEEA